MKEDAGIFSECFSELLVHHKRFGIKSWCKLIRIFRNMIQKVIFFAQDSESTL